MSDKKQSTWELFNSSDLGRSMLAKYPKMTKEALDKIDNNPMSDEDFLKFQNDNKHKFKNLFRDDTNTDTHT